jgi:hypothetical protein
MRAVDELVDLGQLARAGLGVGVHAGDQLELAFAVVGGDVRVRQRRAQRLRVRRQRQAVARHHAQAFLLDAAAHAAQALGRQAGQSLRDGVHGWAGIRRKARKVSGLHDRRWTRPQCHRCGHVLDAVAQADGGVLWYRRHRGVPVFPGWRKRGQALGLRPPRLARSRSSAGMSNR